VTRQQANNNFTSTIPPAIGSIISLIQVDLSHNSLEGSIPDTFAEEPIVQVTVPGTYIAVAVLSKPRLLSVLDFSYNQLSVRAEPLVCHLCGVVGA